MTNDSLVWAAVPHNGDGVVFQVRLDRGLQRFHIARGVFEEVFGLERGASDARQLELFYMYLNRVLPRASAQRSRAGSYTVQLKATDFIARSEGPRRSSVDSMAYRSA